MKAKFSDVQVSDSAQRVIERMGRAGWIIGRAMVTPETVSLELTDLGKRKIRRLAKALRPFEDRFVCDGDRMPSGWEHIKLQFALAIHAGRVGYRMTQSEHLALIIMLACEARKLRLGER